MILLTRRSPVISAIVFSLLASGCLDFGDDIITDSPTADQLAFCETVMHLNEDLRYEPIGFKIIGSGIDDAVWFSFHTDETDPVSIFDSGFIPVDSLRGDVDMYSPEDMPLWWDPQGKELAGGVVALDGGRFMTVGIHRKEEGATVYIFWCES